MNTVGTLSDLMSILFYPAAAMWCYVDLATRARGDK